MNSEAVIFGLLAFAIVIGVPALAIVAMARVGTLKRKMDDEAPRLIARIYGLEKRVAQLEQALGSSTLLPETQPAPQSPAATPPVAAIVPNPEPVPPVLRPVDFVATPVAATPGEQLSSPVVSAAQTSSVRSNHESNENFEALVAGRWLNYVGILALLFAVTFS